MTIGSFPTGGGSPGDGLFAFLFVKTTDGESVQLPGDISLIAFFPFGDPSLYTFDTWIELYLGQATWVSIKQLSAGEVQVSAVGYTLTLSLPVSALNLSATLALVLAGSPAEFTHVSPNTGLLKLAP